MMQANFDRLVDIGIDVRGIIEAKIDHTAWAHSPFLWLRKLPTPHLKGQAGKMLVAEWCRQLNLNVEDCEENGVDFIIEGRGVAVKFSTLWDDGTFRFQQIRDQGYDVCVCLGIAQEDAYCWVIPKGDLYQHVIGSTPQHAGSQGVDTFWLKVNPKSAQKWLTLLGGDVDKATQNLCAMKYVETLDGT